MRHTPPTYLIQSVHVDKTKTLYFTVKKNKKRGQDMEKMIRFDAEQTEYRAGGRQQQERERLLLIRTTSRALLPSATSVSFSFLL